MGEISSMFDICWPTVKSQEITTNHNRLYKQKLLTLEKSIVTNKMALMEQVHKGSSFFELGKTFSLDKEVSV